MKKLLIIATLILSSTLSYAYQAGDVVDGRWVYSHGNNRDGYWFIDKNTISRDSYWMKGSPPPESIRRNYPDAGFMLLRVSLNCTNYSRRVESIILYSRNNEIIDSYTTPQSDPYEYAAPGSILEAKIRALCTRPAQ